MHWHNFYAHGKLLLTAEYFVLDGAQALALPTRLGQTLRVKPNTEASDQVHWKSLDEHNKAWFEGHFDLKNKVVLETTDQEVAIRLQTIFEAISKQRPDFWIHQKGGAFETKLEFPRNWGLGTSSTLISNIARWANINPYQLLWDTFGGSGYDIACAEASGSILYQRIENGAAVEDISFHPTFQKQLYFVYLGKKQNSREGIKRYRERVKKSAHLLLEVNNLTQAFFKAKTLGEFNKLIDIHEALVARMIDLPRAKSLYFKDYWGEIKSLGAWGGDFVLATSDRQEKGTKNYFNEKGFPVVLNYDSVIL